MANYRILWAICITCMNEFEGTGCMKRADEHAKYESTREGAFEIHYVLKYQDGEWINPGGYEERLAATKGFDARARHYPKRAAGPSIKYSAGCLFCRSTVWEGKGCHPRAARHLRDNKHDGWKAKEVPDEGVTVTLLSYSLKDIPFALQRWEKGQ